MSKPLLALAILMVTLATSLDGQTRGTISGFTKDPAGAFVPGVNITVTDERTSIKRTATANENGFYQVLGLVSGVYTIEAEVTGFKRFRNTGVVLRVDENIRADILLELGDVQQTVEVTAAATQIDTRSSESSAIIDDRRIVDLPLANRNVFALAKTLPGVLNVTAPDNSRVNNSRGGPRMNVNGGRENMNYSKFNGAYFMNPSRNTALNVPPPDAIQEFKIQTSNFSADTGRNSGANITIVSRQGTNEFHGALWEFHRNDNLNARSFFQQTKPQLIKNQYGAAAGGPIRKNKAFVFGTFERNTDRVQPTSVDALPPSTRELAGDFSHLTGKKQLLNPFDRSPFAGNQIPRSLFDPAALKILAFVPTVANVGDRYQSLGAQPRDSDLFMVRSDVSLTDKQTLFGTYYLNQTNDILDGPGAFGSSFDGWATQKGYVRMQTASINHVYVLSATILNQVTAAFTRSFSLFGNPISRTPEALGIWNMPTYTNTGAPRFTVTGRWSLLSDSMWKTISNTYQIKNDVSIIHGRHTLKFGFEYMDLSWFQSWLGPPSFNFNGSRTGGGSGPNGDALADFLLGAYESFRVDAGVRHNDEDGAYSVFYIQDDFKVMPRLTLNLGLRYEVSPPWVEKFDRINKVVTDAKAKSSVVPQAPPGLLFPGDTGPDGKKIPRGLMNTDKNNFAPRIGFAWDVLGDGRTAVRGAYGIFYDTHNGDFLAQTNPPFVVGTRTYRDGRMVDPFSSVGEVPLPVVADPKAGTFVLPLTGLWGPQPLEFGSPYIQNWSLFVDRALARDYAFSIGYIGKTGKKLMAFRPFNAAKFVPGTDANGNPLSTRANINQRVPFLPGVYAPGGLYADNSYKSSFNSMQAELRKRFSGGFSFNTSYVWSKSLDFVSWYTSSGGITDPYNMKHSWGRSDWDRKHAFTFAGVWTPPLFEAQRGALGRVLGGWTLTAITTAYSGRPLTFDSGEDTALNGSGQNSRADLVGNPKRSHSSRHDMITQFFNTAAFKTPPIGSVGNSGRGILSGPAQVETDLAVLKDFKVREEMRFQFRGELFNAFNQVNFSNPITTRTNARFGQITGAADGRSMLLGLKFMW